MKQEELYGHGLGGVNLQIINCHNSAKVIGKAAGGIIATAFPVFVTNCSNSGIIMGTDYAGGILGWCNYEPTIYNSYNTGAVNSSSFAGGIVGYVYQSITIKNTYNIGQIKGASSRTGAIKGGGLWSNPVTVIESSFYLDGTAPIGVVMNTDTTIKYNKNEIYSSSFADTLNAYIEDNSSISSDWKKWQSINNSNPEFVN